MYFENDVLVAILFIALAIFFSFFVRTGRAAWSTASNPRQPSLQAQASPFHVTAAGCVGGFQVIICFVLAIICILIAIDFLATGGEYVTSAMESLFG